MRRPQNWKKSPTCFDKTAVFTQWCQNKWGIFSNFCGLLRKTELYYIVFLIPAIKVRIKAAEADLAALPLVIHFTASWIRI